MRTICNLNKPGSYWKMLIFKQVMGQNDPQNNNYSIYGHTFFGHTSAIFCPIGLKIFLVTQEIIIYRLAMVNHDLDTFFWKKTNVWRGKWAWPPRCRQRVWGLKTQRKSWPNGMTFWVNRYVENLSKIRAWTPLKMCLILEGNDLLEVGMAQREKILF